MFRLYYNYCYGAGVWTARSYTRRYRGFHCQSDSLLIIKTRVRPACDSVSEAATFAPPSLEYGESISRMWQAHELDITVFGLKCGCIRLSKVSKAALDKLNEIFHTTVRPTYVTQLRSDWGFNWYLAFGFFFLCIFQIMRSIWFYMVNVCTVYVI